MEAVNIPYAGSFEGRHDAFCILNDGFCSKKDEICI